MDKIAEAVRKAEVNGFVAALIDTGVIKVASEEEAIVIADVIEEHLPEEYDMEDAMAIADEVVAALDENVEGGEEMIDPGMVAEDPGMIVEAAEEVAIAKEAAEAPEINEAAVMAAYGELSLAKEAGDISAEDFEKEAGSLQSMLAAAKAVGKKAYTGDIGAAARSVGGSAKAGLGRVANAVSGAIPASVKAGAGHVAGGAKSVGSAFAGKGIRPNFQKLKSLKSRGSMGNKAEKLTRGRLLSSVGKTTAAYGGAAGVAGAAVGGKALYDKYNQ